MSHLAALGTYLPTWGEEQDRRPGPDEDAVTLAVAAGRAALGCLDEPDVDQVVLVSRDLPLLEGGNAAALLAGLGLPADLPVTEQVGGCPATLDVLTAAAPGTLVLAADLAPAGAAAALVGSDGLEVLPCARRVGSLPVQSRGRDGVARDYEDARLGWDRGGLAAVSALDLAEKPVVVAGATARQAGVLTRGPAPALPVTGASAALFALAALDDLGETGVAVAVEQASATAVRTGRGTTSLCLARDEPAAQSPATLRETPGPEIAISLAAYARAFDAKLRWEAGACDACGTLALPPRLRCLECGSEEGWSLAPLPRTGSVYTAVTVHVPVPGLPTPYSLAIVELDGVDVRALVKVTGAPAGGTAIGDRGRLVLRRVALRSGIPDYGYALLPTDTDPTTEDI
ncbi:OB-fold domain-containing protein [Nocardioides sp. SOB44]|uniref:OB-fold domain-containing protein n=1 Tax=Nocardioides cremeus TaxID=3058044 RepID=A0ABT8TN49_9ACTN|nr:OB-fold domain-containing protein [Nocardioides cremeus]MDO3395389.1 OB-fold domain-containing protein [Nocardioides cremeus]